MLEREGIATTCRRKAGYARLRLLVVQIWYYVRYVKISMRRYANG